MAAHISSLEGMQRPLLDALTASLAAHSEPAPLSASNDPGRIQAKVGQALVG